MNFMPKNSEPLIGIAIATFNRKEVLSECLESIKKNSYKNYLICVCDDGSSDGTSSMIQENFPEVKITYGDGSLWWGGATNKSIKECLALNCDHVVILNDDCMLGENTLKKFVKRSEEFKDRVIAPITLDINNVDQVWWAGGFWGPLNKLPFIWLTTQFLEHEADISSLPSKPYDIDEFTGRGIFIPRSVFENVGLIDEKLFPQYGSDTDFSLRIASTKHKAIIDPFNKVYLYVEKAGQNTSGNFFGLPVRFFKLLFFRKNGELAIFWWKLLRRHAPFYAVIPSYIFILILAFLRSFNLLPFMKALAGFFGYKKKK